MMRVRNCSWCLRAAALPVREKQPDEAWYVRLMFFLLNVSSVYRYELSFVYDTRNPWVDQYESNWCCLLVSAVILLVVVAELVIVSMPIVIVRSGVTGMGALMPVCRVHCLLEVLLPCRILCSFPLVLSPVS